MDANTISAFASVATALITAVGFWAVRAQMRATAVDHLHSRMHDIHKMFLADTKLHRAFFGVKPSVVPDDMNVVAELMGDFFQQISLELDHLPRDAAVGWRRYMKQTYWRSEILRDYFERNKDWYPPDFVKNAVLKP
jgi:hypothetical protein